MLTWVQLAAALDPEAYHYCSLSRSHSGLLKVLSLIVSLFFPTPSHPFSFNEIYSHTLLCPSWPSFSANYFRKHPPRSAEGRRIYFQSFSTSSKYCFLYVRTAVLPQKPLPFCSYTIASLGFLCILTASTTLQRSHCAVLTNISLHIPNTVAYNWQRNTLYVWKGSQ